VVAVSRFERLVAAVTGHSRVAIAVLLLVTVALGAGAAQVEESSSLDQFQTETEESRTLDYVQANFSAGDANTTTAQVIVRSTDGGNVLSKASLVDVLQFQRSIREDPTVNDTLVDDGPTFGVANVVATAGIRTEQASELRRDARRLQERRAAIEENRSALQARSDELNATARDLRAALTALREDPNASADERFDAVAADAPVEFDGADRERFRQAATALRTAPNQSAAERAYRLGTRGVLEDEYAAVEERGEQLRAAGEELQADAEALEERRAALENASAPTLAEQVDYLESANESTVESVVGRVLAENATNDAVFGLMRTDFDRGSTEATATMVVVTHALEGGPSPSGTAPQPIVDAQLAIQDAGQARSDGLEYLVFGSGIITNEINASMTDSLTIVGPLAMLFVLLALAVAYRDVVDILLGLFGIFAVLMWTFGFMGWTGIAFNQIFVAVPVLLIGLSIDYAIHIFMRHREERALADEDAGSRPSMTVALAGVGIALVWVTATTVIGFLSNLTSPVPPIREFGVVSSVGIVAALAVFGVLIPALKVTIDEFLENRGFDRRKRAFGTGGGRFSSVLAVGATAAKKAPWVVVVLALLVTAGGAYGATQVDTSFDQSDFLAEDPPGWMENLPEPFRPGEYTAKANLDVVNDDFVREDSTAQLLFRGDVTGDAALQELAAARDRAAEAEVTQQVSGDPAIAGPLEAMRSVAAEDDGFAATFAGADTDGDGVPDRDVEAVYDAFYEAAPATADDYLYRTGPDDYRALRLVVTVEGGASGAAVTDGMRSVADGVGGGLTASATGQAILNKVVQDQLLETVVQSLVITLVAVFAFLMITYRIVEGSATLGVVTLLPVALTVAWILGTMFLLGISFNVLTGMITSLTVGLGVAYSIHLSERYNQELDRRDSVWEAMNTAVTGTGGALLGSAATTVGGFGVLVFAILPPLQQFGLITAMTIVYAFLASVLVLPSLLVVWTRFFGPDERRSDFEDADVGWVAPGGGGPPAGADPDQPEPEPSAVANGTGGDAPTAVTNGEGGESVVGVGDGPAAARRSVRFAHCRPGQSFEVDVEVAGVDAGRRVLHERFDGEGLAVADVEPDPVTVVERGRSAYVVWGEAADGPARVRYVATVPGDAPDASEFGFEGVVATADGDVPVAGDDRVTVVEDLFERLLARGTVTDEDVDTASEQLAAGELTETQFERIYRKWLAETDGAEAADPPESTED
jgi:predicted RND superfamily exporter protein